MTTVHSRPARAVDPVLLARALDVAGQLANDAAEVIAATAGRHGSGADGAASASVFDWLTDTEGALERHTRRVLAAEFGPAPVLVRGCTPGPETAYAEYRWVVDPVDGGANYLGGLPWYAYSVALLDAAGPVVGVVADPARKQIYAAARGRGMRANGAAVPRLGTLPLCGALVCAESSGVRPWPGMPDFAGRAAAAGTSVRVLGSPALAVAQVALGNAAAAVLPGHRHWDLAAPTALALEVGAEVSDQSPDGLLVAAPGVAQEILGWWLPDAGSTTGAEPRPGVGPRPGRAPD